METQITRSGANGNAERLPAYGFSRSEQSAIADFLDIPKLLSVLLRERWLVVAPLVFTLAVTGAYVMLATPRYTATAQILIELQQPKILAGENPIPGLDVSRYMIGAVIDSQVAILQSTSIAARVIRQLNLAKFDDTSDADRPGTKVSSIAATGIPAAQASDATVSTRDLETFIAGLDVKRYGLTLILQIQYSDEDPKRAAAIANAVARAYLDDQTETKIDLARQTNARISDRVESLRREVLAIEKQIQSFRETHDLVDVAGQTLFEREVTETLAQLIAARSMAADRLAEVKQIERLSALGDGMTSIGRVMASASIAQLRQQESQLLRHIASASKQYGAQDPQVIRANSELEDLRSEIEKETQRIAQTARNDHAVAVGRVQLLEEKLQQLVNSLARTNQSRVELSELERQSKAASELYQTLLARLKETETQQSFVAPDARLVAAASVPLAPSSPRKAMAMVLALMGGLGLGLTLALLKSHLSVRIHGIEDLAKLDFVEHAVSLPYLAMDPAARLAAIIAEPNGAYAQAMFSIRQRLMNGREDGRGLIVAVIAPAEDAGKTTISANLAHYAARAGAKVLLVDSDLRHPELSELLGRPAGATLLDLSAGKGEAVSAMARLSASGAAFCSAAAPGGQQHAMELLASDRLLQAIRTLADRYELIVIDTTALIYLDAQHLASMADVAVVAVAAHETSPTDLQRLSELLPDLTSKPVSFALSELKKPAPLAKYIEAPQPLAWQRHA